MSVTAAQPQPTTANRSSVDPTVGVPGAREAVGSAVVLLLGAVIVVLGAVLGVVRSADGSPVGMATGAVWTVVLPAVVALAVTRLRPVVGLAVTAGAGMVGIARLLADLAVVTAPDAAIRPEYFYELSDRAQPFTATGAAFVVVVGDACMVGAGLLAARRLGGEMSLPMPEPLFSAAGGPALAEGTAIGSGPELLARALGSDSGALSEDNALPARVRNNVLIAAGFAAILALLTGSLTLPYTGGYSAARYLPAELGLWGIGAALATSLVATVAVLVAAVLPRPVALGLLGGVALAAAVPFLTAIAVRVAAVPVHLNSAVAVGLLGAVVLAGAGLPTGVRRATGDDGSPSARARTWRKYAGAVLSLVTALAAGAAWRLAQLRYNGSVDPVGTDGFAISAPLAVPFLAAAVLPLVAGALWLVPRTARAGRAVAVLGWPAVFFALTQSLYLLGQVVASASVPNAGFAAPSWSAGPGLWCGVAGVLTGLAAAALALAGERQADDASLLLRHEDRADGSWKIRRWVATGLSVVAVVAMALPVYRTDTGSSSTLLVGFHIDAWGVLALAVGVVVGAFRGARSSRVLGAVAYPLAAAVLALSRLLVPAAVRAQSGFAVQPGLVVGYVVVGLFAAAAVLFGLSSARITRMGGITRTGRSAPVSPAPVGKAAAAAPARRSGSVPVGRAAAGGRGSAGQRGRSTRSGASSSKGTKGRPS